MSELGRKTERRTVSAPVLVSYYDRYSNQYGEDYPRVLNPPALMNGIAKVARKMCDDELPDVLFLYVIEDEEDAENPRASQYVITLTARKGEDGEPDAFFIHLFYTKTQEIESVSVVEESKVVWSPDNMKNSQHAQRTKYYLGFTYMLCNNSPDFDIVPVPELELTGADLLKIGVEGEIPPEMIEIKLPKPGNDDAEVIIHEREEETESSNIVEEVQVVEEDDTELMIDTEDDYDTLYDDLETDYEELFD